MSDPMQGVVVPVSATLVIDGTRYDLVSFEITYVANGPATAQCSLAVGYKGDKSGDLGAGLLEHPRGVSATIEFVVGNTVTDPVSGTVLLHAGVHTAFTGLLDDVGAGNLSKGNFNLHVSLVSSLSVLATGTLQLGRLIACSAIDTSVPISISMEREQRTVGPAGLIFESGNVALDFWAETKRIFNGIIVQGATGFNDTSARRSFVDVFGSDLNQDAIEEINTIGGTLVLGKINQEPIVKALADYLNILFTNDFAIQSFYSRTVALSQEFKFRIVENFNGISVVPYSPFFPKELAIPIHPSTVTDMNWMNREPNSLLGVALIVSGPTGTDARQTHNSVVLGAYKRPTGISARPLGAILAVPSPPWLAVKSFVRGNTYSIEMDAELLRPLIGDPYAKETCLELAYRGYGLQIMCPLRTDIGVCDPVQVIYPALPGTGLGPSVYGSVQVVKLCMDAVKKQAYTTMEIGYARSDTLQAQELDDYQHPVWTTQYAGARLDAVG